MRSRTKLERIEVRLTGSQKRQIERAARRLGVSVSHFVLSSAERAASEPARQPLTIRLDVQQSEALTRALLNPPRPTPAAVEAARRYRKSAAKASAATTGRR